MLVTINGMYTLQNYKDEQGAYIVYDIIFVDNSIGKNKGVRFEYIDTFNDKSKALKYALEKRLYVTEKRFIKIA